MAVDNRKTDSLVLLQRRWWGVTAVYLITLLSFFCILRIAVFGRATHWLIQALILAVICLWLVWHHLPENHREGETFVLPTFGWGNGLTLLRGLFVSMVAGFLFIPWPDGWLAWLPALLYTIAAIADFLDGYVARKTNHATLLGARLDMEFDGLGMLIVILLAVWFGQLPWWYLLIGLARYGFIFGLWLRQKRHLPDHPLPHSWHRRIFAGYQMGFMSAVLWPIVPAPMATIAGVVLAAATAASFLRDWLLVVGWLDCQSRFYQQWQSRFYRLFSIYLPPVLRFIFAGCVWGLSVQLANPWQPVGWTALFSSWQLPWPAAIASFFAIAGLVAAILVTLGVLGRTLTLLVMFPIGFDMTVNGATALNSMAMVCATLIMLLGTGALSLWQPEERFLVRRAGE